MSSKKSASAVEDIDDISVELPPIVIQAGDVRLQANSTEEMEKIAAIFCDSIYPLLYEDKPKRGRPKLAADPMEEAPGTDE
jgi:hypothetical protein